MNRSNMLLVSLIAVPTLLSGLTIAINSTLAQNPNSAPRHVQWDYKIEQDSRGLQMALDTLGNEGWELVCSIPQAGSDSVKIVFKRPK